MMKKKILAMVMAMVIAGAMCGCSDSGGGSGASGAAETDDSINGQNEADENAGESETKLPEPGEISGEGMKLGYVVMDTASIYSDFIDGFKEQCEEINAEPIIIGYNNDPTKFAEACENMMSKGVDGVYTWPSDQANADYAAEFFGAQDIPVASMGIPTENSTYDLVADQRAFGELCAEQASQWIQENFGDKEFKYAVLEYTEAEHVTERTRGIEEKFEELCPQGECIATAEALSMEDGMTATENFLQTAQDLQIVLACSDDAAMGAVEVFRGAGKTGEDYGIWGTGFGSQIGNAIIEGDVYRGSQRFLADVNDSGYTVPQLLVLAVQRTPAQKTCQSGFEVVNSENVEEIMDKLGYEILEQ